MGTGIPSESLWLTFLIPLYSDDYVLMKVTGAYNLIDIHINLRQNIQTSFILLSKDGLWRLLVRCHNGEGPWHKSIEKNSTEK